MRDAPASRSDGLDLDLVGDGGVTLGMRGEEDGDERGDDEVERSGAGAVWSRPKDDMSSTKEGSVVVIVKIS